MLLKYIYNIPITNWWDSDVSLLYPAWPADTKFQQESLQGHIESVYSVAFPPDGKQIVSGSYSKMVHTCNAQTLTEISKNTFTLSFCPWHPEHHLTHTHLPLQGVHLNTDGWLYGTDSSLLLWIPPDYQSRLMFPHMQILISKHTPISLDLSNFVHGKDWVKCFKYNYSSY